MPSEQHVRYCGRNVPVLGAMTVGNRQYLLLEKIGRGERQRYWVFDRHAGPRGDFRQILVFPRPLTSRQHIGVLHRLSRGNPNLPTILEYRVRDEEVFVVTTWVRGDDLETFLTHAQSGSAPWPSPIEVMKLYRGLAHGLNQMGRHRNVVHGDIKPSNLVLTREPNRLVLIDFGSAWTVERTVQHWQTNEGDGYSEHYAAPEQLCEPRRADFRSDQFSATAVAYRMLTGEVPYAGKGGLAGKPQNRQTYEPRYRPPSQGCPLRDRLPKRIWELIDEIVAQGLKLDPASRFQSGTLWIEALEDLHCEMRVKKRVRFNLWDNLLIRLFEWFGGGSARPR